MVKALVRGWKEGGGLTSSLTHDMTYIYVDLFKNWKDGRKRAV